MHLYMKGTGFIMENKDSELFCEFLEKMVVPFENENKT